MEVPLNIIHDYIGLPVLLGVSIDLFNRQRVSKNSTTFRFAWACLLAAIACVAFGLPPLLTSDPKILSIGTLIGDTAISLTMFFLWTIVIRAFLGRSKLFSRLAWVAAAVLTAANIVENFVRNLSTSPYSTELVTNANGRIAVVYNDSTLYPILHGLNSLALLLVAIFFWTQAKDAPDRGQKVRIRSLAVGFMLFTAAYVISPTFPLEQQAVVSAILLSSGLLIIGLANIVGSMISRQTPPVAKTPAVDEVVDQ